MLFGKSNRKKDSSNKNNCDNEGDTMRGLAISKKGVLAGKCSLDLTVGDLEKLLFCKFPISTAEPWDKNGLTVGTRSSKITGVCLALDPTRAAIKFAYERGCNVLLTHHPAFLEAPCVIDENSIIASALKNNVSLINFHTPLDVCDGAKDLLVNLCGAVPDGGVLLPVESNKNLGYGHIGKYADVTAEVTLARLAARIKAKVGRSPKFWGNADAKIKTIACAFGAATDLCSLALDAGIDCLVAGEIKYHAALDASDRGLKIIEMGHDLSEILLLGVLKSALLDFGFKTDDIKVCDQTQNWSYVESLTL